MVPFADQNAALEALRIRRPDLEGAELKLKAEAAEWLIDWLDVTDGQSLIIAVVR